MLQNEMGLIQFSIDRGETLDPIDLINRKVDTKKYQYLLSYHLDGVIWGVVKSNSLRTSTKEFKQESPEFKNDTLQQAHLFSLSAELFLWKEGSVWKTRELIEETVGGYKMRAFEEQFILWGTKIEDQVKDFSRVSEGQRGIIHTPPIVPKLSKFKPYSMKLLVRHYMDFDSDGSAEIAFSRPVSLILR